MRAHRRLLALSACALLLLAGCGRDPAALHGSDQVGVTVLPAGEHVDMPAITGTTLDGSTVSIPELAGKVVVLNSWASWCGPCKEETPTLVKALKTFSADDVAFVGIDVTDETAAANEFVTKYGVQYPSIADTKGAVLASLPGVPPQAVPNTLILDREGKLAVRIIGAVPADTFDSLVQGVVDQ
ncbi:MAG: putative cytochrome c biosis protein [Actinomycetota bacterium]